MRAPRVVTIRAFALWLAAGAAGASGCAETAPARPQILLFVDTDAPVPRMLDRLRIEVLDSNVERLCPSCVREIAIDEGTSWPLSFGVAGVPDPTTGERLYVRAILFASGRSAAGVPYPETSVDRLALVPMPHDVDRRELLLAFDCVGVPVDLVTRSTCVSADARWQPATEAEPSRDAPTRARSWDDPFERDCRDAPRPGDPPDEEEVCVRGGVFWLGDWRVRGLGSAFDAVPERAVALSPFYLDRFEYTVARYRRALARGFDSRDLTPFVRDDPRLTGESRALSAGCNLYAEAAADLDRDAMPLNCVSSVTASDLCAFEGKSLTSEAQWEWAAGAGPGERLYPWGDDAPRCGDAAIRAVYDPAAGCAPHPDPQFLLSGAPVGTHPRDRTADGAMDLAGNVSEAVLDRFQTYVEPCWMPGAYAADPVCSPPPPDVSLPRSLRGANFSLDVATPWTVPQRGAVSSIAPETRIGFRCARSE